MYGNTMRLFLNKLDTGLSKEAQGALATVIRRKVRERGISPRVIPFETISPGDVRIQRDLDRDIIYFVGEKEADSYAMVLTLEGKPGIVEPRGTRFRVDFYQFATPKVKKHEINLLSYTYSFEKWLEENVVYDIEEAYDSKFLTLALRAAETTGQILKKEDSDTAEAKFTLSDLIDLQKVLTSTKKASDANIVVMNKTTFLEFLGQGTTVFGDVLQKEIVINGYKYQTLLDTAFVVTENNVVVPPGIVYAFAKPQYLGVVPVLHDIKFFIKKEGPEVEWNTWSILGMNIANAYGVAVMIYKSKGWDYDPNGSPAVSKITYTVDGVGYTEPPYPER
jgi:hypothetical protein